MALNVRRIRCIPGAAKGDVAKGTIGSLWINLTTRSRTRDGFVSNRPVAANGPATRRYVKEGV